MDTIKNKCAIESNLVSYHPYIGQKGETMRSGCGFFIPSNIKYFSRTDLDIYYVEAGNELMDRTNKQ